MLTRRELLQRGAVGGAVLAMPGALLRTGTSLAAPGLTPYLDPMPLLTNNALDMTAGGTVNLTATMVSRQVHQNMPATPMFGYVPTNGPGPNAAESYLGPAIVARTGKQVNVNYTNGLDANDYLNVFTNQGSSYTQFPPAAETRILTHLHGGLVAGADDGNPFEHHGAFASGAVQTVKYPNDQAATLLWYHDHYVGATRMNVIAGLAAGYLIRDDQDTGGANNPVGLPGPLATQRRADGTPDGYELPLVVQDRIFNPDGTLLYPVAPAAVNGPWIGEFFGDTMLVNGKVWPSLRVDPALYRFRILNGCNSRILNLNIPGARMWIVGSEGGLLPGTPVPASKIVMAPAERFDVLVDFSGLAGMTVKVKNNNPPQPIVTPATSLTPVMQITVNATAPAGAPQVPALANAPTFAPPPIDDLRGLGAPQLSGGTVKSRMVTLNEVGAGTAAWRLNLNGVPFEDATAPVQTVKWNDVEDWYFVNVSADTHPMHTHLFMGQVMGRYEFDAAGYMAAFGGVNGVPQQDVATLTPFLKSGLKPFAPEEAGYKDTYKANPGQVTVVRVKVVPPSTAKDPLTGALTEQKYVHHCHIVEHEDNDMMERVLAQP